MAALKSLSDNSNIWFILVWTLVGYVFLIHAVIFWFSWYGSDFLLHHRYHILRLYYPEILYSGPYLIFFPLLFNHLSPCKSVTWGLGGGVFRFLLGPGIVAPPPHHHTHTPRPLQQKIGHWRTLLCFPLWDLGCIISSLLILLPPRNGWGKRSAN